MLKTSWSPKRAWAEELHLPRASFFHCLRNCKKSKLLEQLFFSEKLLEVVGGRKGFPINKSAKQSKSYTHLQLGTCPRKAKRENTISHSEKYLETEMQIQRLLYGADCLEGDHAAYARQPGDQA